MTAMDDTRCATCGHHRALHPHARCDFVSYQGHIGYPCLCKRFVGVPEKIGVLTSWLCKCGATLYIHPDDMGRHVDLSRHPDVLHPDVILARVTEEDMYWALFATAIHPLRKEKRLRIRAQLMLAALRGVPQPVAPEPCCPHPVGEHGFAGCMHLVSVPIEDHPRTFCSCEVSGPGPDAADAVAAQIEAEARPAPGSTGPLDDDEVTDLIDAYEAAPGSTGPQDTTRGASMWLSREDWGVVTDALMEHGASAGRRKDANPESTSDVRVDDCARMLVAIRDLLSEVVRPCPIRSSITDQPCLLPDGHPANSAVRFHRYAAPGST